MESDISSNKSFHTSDLDKTKLGNYVLGRVIGEGQFGKIRRATHIPTNEKVAVRIIEKFRVELDNEVEHFAR